VVARRCCQLTTSITRNPQVLRNRYYCPKEYSTLSLSEIALVMSPKKGRRAGPSTSTLFWFGGTTRRYCRSTAPSPLLLELIWRFVSVMVFSGNDRQPLLCRMRREVATSVLRCPAEVRRNLLPRVAPLRR